MVYQGQDQKIPIRRWQTSSERDSPRHLFSRIGTLGYDDSSRSLEAMAASVQCVAADRSLGRRAYQIIDELLTNLCLHAVQLEAYSWMTTCELRQVGPSKIIVRIGNVLRPADRQRLEERLREVEAMSPEALKAKLRSSLGDKSVSSRGGGGAGLYTIMRYQPKLRAEFSPLGDGMEYCVLNVTLV